jgi:hypothetical protein
MHPLEKLLTLGITSKSCRVSPGKLFIIRRAARSMLVHETPPLRKK